MDWRRGWERMELSGLTADERSVYLSVQHLAQDVMAKHSVAYDRNKIFPRDHMQLLGRHGYLGLTVDPAWGGGGASYVAQALAVEALAAVDAATAALYEVHNALHLEGIERYGTDEQRRQWLPALISGEWIGGFALSESAAGSHAAAISTRAMKTSDGYRLQGRKAFVTGAGEADCYLVFATVAPERGIEGITAFWVEQSAAGLEVGPTLEKMGLHALNTAELVFNQVRVPETQRLGREGQGYAIALDLLDGGRIGVAAQGTGILRTVLAKSVQYAKTRHQFGQPIGRFQAIQSLLAEMALDLQAARLLTYEAARQRTAGPLQRPLFAMAKWFASEKAVYHALKAIQIHGGYGYLVESGIERLLRDAKVTEIYEGTTEILRTVIAARLLKDYDWDNV